MSVTPFQTVGPYVDVLLRSRHACRQVTGDAHGERIVVEGTLYDGEGHPISDGLIESWQADADGRYAHPDDSRAASADPGFTGAGWCHTDGKGRFRFETIRPGRVDGPDGTRQAPHIVIGVLARGILLRYVTRLYFGDESDANTQDAVLALVPEARRHTLIAQRRDASCIYLFDIRLQGADETVFFDV